MDDGKQEWSEGLKSATMRALRDELVSAGPVIPMKNLLGCFGNLHLSQPPANSLTIVEHLTQKIHKFTNVGELLEAGWAID
jgi:hypothetical protein